MSCFVEDEGMGMVGYFVVVLCLVVDSLGMVIVGVFWCVRLVVCWVFVVVIV